MRPVATGGGVRVLQVYSQVRYLPTAPSFTRKPAVGTPPWPQGPRALQGTQSCLQGRKQEAQSPGREAALAWASLAQRFPASSLAEECCAHSSEGLKLWSL